MIRNYVADLAAQAGIELSGVRFVEGRTVGCLDVHLLHLAADKHLVSALVYQHELDALHNGSCCKRLDKKIHSALARLQLLMDT